jgi:hypothetical protein
MIILRFSLVKAPDTLSTRKKVEKSECRCQSVAAEISIREKADIASTFYDYLKIRLFSKGPRHIKQKGKSQLYIPFLKDC